MNTANWDIQDHPAKQGAVTALGAAFSVPAGRGVVEGNEIPYLPDAAAKKKENAENWLTLDPEIKCYLPGVPRATYMPHPFQIFQTPEQVLMDQFQRQEVWRIAESSAISEQERVVLRETFLYDLPPRAILRRHPDLFSDAHSIYTTKRNFFERLQRSPELRLIYQEWQSA